METKNKPIKKGIYLSALIYIEGYQAPADDFIGLTTSVLHNALGQCLAAPHMGLTMTWKSVDVQNDIEEDDDSDAPEKKKDKFQF